MPRRRGISTLIAETGERFLYRLTGISHSLLGLSSIQLRNLAMLCLKVSDANQLTAERLQRELNLSTTDAVRIVRTVFTATSTTTRDLAIAAAACAEYKTMDEHKLEKVDVACTAPTQFTTPVRTTFATMMEMVAEAQNSIVIVGYLFTKGAADFVKQLSRARHRAVSVTIIGNRLLPSMQLLKELWGPTHAPTVYSWDNDGPSKKTSLHAKLLICDRNSALVTSANFSLHGLHENIEIGLKVRSPSVERLSDFVAHLIRSQTVAFVPWD